jgi:hypothetical protein
LLEGIPALAHARRFEAGTWKRFETKPTTTGWDYALMERALDAAATLGPISVSSLEGRNGGIPVDAAAQKMLNAYRPNDEGSFAGAGIPASVRCQNQENRVRVRDRACHDVLAETNRPLMVVTTLVVRYGAFDLECSSRTG